MRDASRAAYEIRQALRVPDAAQQSSPVRVYAPDGTLRAELTVSEWIRRFPHRLTRRGGRTPWLSR